MKFDVAVVGAGLVGAAFARALRGLSVAVVAPARPRPPEGAFDSRIYAISPGNAVFLTGLNAWQQMPPERVTPVRAMRVHGDDGGLIEFDAYSAGVEALAYIVEEGLLLGALWRGLEARDDAKIFAPEECTGLGAGEDPVTLDLRSGQTIEASLVVGADGARSFVRTRAGIAADERPYGQAAVVANFACERPHRNVAFQWFRGGPVLALLPLPGEHVSMVWSVEHGEASRLCALRSEDLSREVESASNHALGSLSLVTRARAFALRRLEASAMTAPRVALVGDAAHVVHPLAGQGANLGFGDARELAAALNAREPFRAPGDARLLRRYERARAEAILAMRAAVHGLWRLFGARGAPVVRLRNAGLNLTDRLPVIKNLLMRQAMR